jgi:phosphocarrier protein HPr
MSEAHQCTLTIINKLGLHARAAAKFVTCASGFASEITLRRGEREVNGKSIMGVMMLAAAKGTDIDIEVIGDDAVQAVQALQDLVADRFGEEE